MAIVTKRTVFHNGQGGFDLTCSACKSKFEPPERWGDAVNEWYQQSGPGHLACPICGVALPIDKWQHDPPWGFGDLGFQWNWPPFTEAFVSAFQKQLASRIVRVHGKL